MLTFEQLSPEKPLRSVELVRPRDSVFEERRRIFGTLHTAAQKFLTPSTQIKTFEKLFGVPLSEKEEDHFFLHGMNRGFHDFRILEGIAEILHRKGEAGLLEMGCGSTYGSYFIRRDYLSGLFSFNYHKGNSAHFGAPWLARAIRRITDETVQLFATDIIGDHKNQTDVSVTYVSTSGKTASVRLSDDSFNGESFKDAISPFDVATGTLRHTSLEKLQGLIGQRAHDQRTQRLLEILKTMTGDRNLNSDGIFIRPSVDVEVEKALFSLQTSGGIGLQNLCRPWFVHSSIPRSLDMIYLRHGELTLEQLKSDSKITSRLQSEGYFLLNRDTDEPLMLDLPITGQRNISTEHDPIEKNLRSDLVVCMKILNQYLLRYLLRKTITSASCDESGVRDQRRDFELRQNFQEGSKHALRVAGKSDLPGEQFLAISAYLAQRIRGSADWKDHQTLVYLATQSSLVSDDVLKQVSLSNLSKLHILVLMKQLNGVQFKDPHPHETVIKKNLKEMYGVFFISAGLPHDLLDLFPELKSTL